MNPCAQLTELDTYSTGSRNLYTLSTQSKSFHAMQLRKRVKMSIMGTFALLTSTCLRKIKRGDIFVIKLKTMTEWAFGFVSSITYYVTSSTNEYDVVFDVWLWDGPIDENGLPSFFTLEWDNACSHFRPTKIHSKAVDKMEFVNIVCGSDKIVDPRTRNHVDGGLQCLNDGPSNISRYMDIPLLEIDDVCRIIPERPLLYPAPVRSHWDDQVCQDCQHWLDDIFVNNESCTRTVIVSSSSDIQSYARNIPLKSRDLFWIPDINSVDNRVVKFYGVGAFTYDLIRRHGVNTRMLTDLLQIHNQVEESLVQIPTDEGPNHTTCVFAGEGCCPIVDDSFECTGVEGSPLLVHMKDCKVNPGGTYVPLSVSMHHPGFHGMQVTLSDVKILEQGFGTPSGICGGRKMSKHHGSLSYIGPRASSQSQPSPTEGPKAKGYHYFRQSISHIYWPFVLHLIMALSTNLIYASYYHHRYLSRFVYKRILKEDEQKKERMRMDLADIFIFTVNYDNTMHVDKDGLPTLNDWVLKENLINAECDQSRDNFANHVKGWGLGVPTTCGYQVLKYEDYADAEVIQFFCCRGLGICFRIRNYWTHLFLAHCFSHYTSTMIVICKGHVFIGDHPYVKIFAWGKGRPKS